jgi:hypothetical protein
VNRTLLTSCAVMALTLAAAARADADPLSFSGPISVTYYSTFLEDPGVGISFADPFGGDTMASVDELRDIGGTDSAPNWPDGSIEFGADFTGSLTAASAGTYDVAFGTDDAGYLFIDGVQVAAQPGLHGIGVTDYSAVLAAGSHSFEIQYDNGGGGGAVAQFIPGDLIGAGVPEPASWTLMLLGFGGLGVILRRRRQPIAVAA